MNKRRVVVTGYGGVSSLGSNSNEIWDSIIAKNVGYSRFDHPNPGVQSKFFGIINYELNLGMFSKTLLKGLPRFAKLGLIASKEAIEMAFGTNVDIYEYYIPFRVGVIFGTGWGGHDSIVQNSNSYNENGFANPLTNIMSMSSIGTAAISINWGMRGYQNTPIAACATGNIAIGDAYSVIKSGRADVMIAGGGESIRDNFSVWSVDILGALSKEKEEITKACCPFSLDRSGFVMSEGAAVVCLEEYEGAKKRGANILAEIIGYGNFSDATDVTAPAQDFLGRIMTIKESLQSSGIKPNQIDYINAHGTSTQLNDVNETKALKLSLGNYAYSIPTSSTKSYTGHLIAAAGSLESILSIKSILTNTIPATIHLENADPECDLDYVPGNHRFNEIINTVMNVNYGFGGSNGALIFRRV